MNVRFLSQTIYYGPRPSQYAIIHEPNVWNEKTIILVILVHGGYFRDIHTENLMTPLAYDLAAEGYTVANMHYVPAGDQLNAVEMVQAFCNGIKFIRGHIRQGRQNPRLSTAIVGHSAGGYYALMSALQPSFGEDVPFRIEHPFVPELVIAQAPLSDLFLGHKQGLSTDGQAIKLFVESGGLVGASDDHYRLLSPVSYRLPKELQVKIWHGDKDDEVPVTQSVVFASRAQCDLTVNGFDHYNLIDPEHPIWQEQKKYIFDSLRQK